MTTLPEEPTAKVKVTSQESQGSKLFKIIYFDLQPTFRITFDYLRNKTFLVTLRHIFLESWSQKQYFDSPRFDMFFFDGISR